MSALTVASSISALGVPTREGVVSSIRVGAYPNDWIERLVSRLDNNGKLRWMSAKPHSMIESQDADPLTAVFHVPPTAWSYAGVPYAGNTYAWGYTIKVLHRANALYQAGLRLQERLKTMLGSGAPAEAIQAAVFYYQWDSGDATHYAIPPVVDQNGLGFGNVVIGPLYAGDSNVGVHEEDTGWQDLALVPTKDALYPDFYQFGASTGYGRMHHLTLWLRWVSPPLN